MLKNELNGLYKLLIGGFATLVTIAISPTAQAQSQTTPDSPQTPADANSESIDGIPEVFTPQVPEIQEDTTQLQDQLQEDNVPAQATPHEAESELNQINTDEQQLEQNDQGQLGSTDQLPAQVGPP